MKTAIIIHGTYSTPQENWFPWLKNELSKTGWRVFVPAFPTPEGQTLENWLKVFDGYKQYLDEESILIGHSIAVAFILNVLEQLEHPVRAVFLVGGFLKKLNRPEFVELNKTFVDRDFDWMKIKQNCKDFFVINSDNDTYVPLEKGQEIADALGVDLVIVPRAGHFNTKAGYTEFPFLLEKVANLSP